MFDVLLRKARGLAGDPVLRQWLVRRLTGRAAGTPAFTPHRPPYLNGLAGPDAGSPAPPEPFQPLSAPPPANAITLPLPGLRLKLTPEDATGVFARPYADVETLLALHRFAWLPFVRDGDAAAWGQALWDEWRRSFAQPDDGWAWHPYTATERAANLLDLARTAGLPEPVDETAALLAEHATAINGRLEYLGEHATSNHLSNNGRGLYRLGLALGLDWAAERGWRILEEEARRLLMPSGMLREGSSHYHLLIARNYVDAWLAAGRHGRPEAPVLRDIAARALAVVPWLILPGGMPLVGDVSPDCPPEYLLGLSGAEIGWVGRLPPDDRRALLDLIGETPAADEDTLKGDGWFRFGHGPWSALWHLPPAGWPPIPGHGHQDAGSFEVHFRDMAVFVDPGRGAYGEAGDAALYRSGRVHNTVLVAGRDPFPPNKPYYDESFRGAVAGPPPEIGAAGDAVTLAHHGFRRLKGVGAVRRQWRFSEAGMTLTDAVDGAGRRTITRMFVTPLDAEIDSEAVVLTGGGRTFRLEAPDAAVRLEPMTLWRAYGEGRPGHGIALRTEASLPWSGEVRLEVR